MKASFSLKPSERLKKSSQFGKVYKEGRPVKSGNFKLILLQTELPYNRIGFSINSRRIPLASRRTRVKRLLREVFRQNKSFLKEGFDMVITAGSGAQGLGFAAVREELFSLYRKAGLLLN